MSKDLTFHDRKSGDRRQNETATSNGKIYTRNIGDRVIVGKERRKRNRRNELIDSTHITITNKDGSRYRVL